MSEITRQTTFNPSTFRRDFEALAEKNPRRASSFATSIAERLENALMEAETVANLLVETASFGGTAFVLGILEGMAEEKKAKMIEDWRNPDGKDSDVAKKALELREKGTVTDLTKTSPFKEGGFREPGEFLGVPTSFWATLALGGGAYAARNTGFGSVLKASAFGSFGAFMTYLGRDVGGDLGAKKDKKKDTENA